MRKEVYYGIIAGLVLLTLYTALLYFLNGAGHTLEQFNQFGILIVLLAAGFGTQVGLFFYGRNELKSRAATKAMAATGSVSAGSMIACCLHHVTDFIPILGVSGLFLLASEYTLFFLVIGLFSNVVGIAFMLSVLQQHRVFPFHSLSTLPWKEIRNVSAVISVIGIVALASFLWLIPTANASIQLAGVSGTSLPTKIDNQQNIEVKVTPILSSTETKFNITFTTHSIDLGFRVEEIAQLTDSTGKKYTPIAWNGSQPGGHHRSGDLIFSAIPANTKSLTLTLSRVGGVSRTFSWEMSSQINPN